MPAPTYVRIQARYRGRLGVEVGIFVAVDHLRRAGRLNVAQEAQYLDIDDWFNQHLPNPDFYADGNTAGAITWFKQPLPDALPNGCAHCAPSSMITTLPMTPSPPTTQEH